MFRKPKFRHPVLQRPRVIIWCYADKSHWLVSVEGVELEEIECPSRVDAEHMARLIALSIQLSGGTAQIRRKNKRGRFLPEWTFGADPESRPG